MQKMNSLTVLCLILGVQVCSWSGDDGVILALQGEPFGVARVECMLPADADVSRLPIPRSLALGGNHRRVLYPVFWVNKDNPRQCILSFLFRGTAPFSVATRGIVNSSAEVVPTHAPQQRYQELLEEWWAHYQAAAQRVSCEEDYSPLVENYLAAMLARRLHLKLDPSQQPFYAPNEAITRELGLFLGTESIRVALQNKQFLATGVDVEPGRLPLPAAVAVQPVVLPPLLHEPQVEDLASVVPEECFYIHFPTFPKLGQLRRKLEAWGGTVDQLITMRGVDDDVAAKLERQFALPETDLAALADKDCIGAVAVIGCDTFLREGPALGLILEARQPETLAAGLAEVRKRIVVDWGARKESLILQGQTVDYLFTDDRRVRSFHVSHGKYHLITNTRTIAARFLEAAANIRPLKADAGFRHARTSFPPDSRDEAFIFLSDPFIRALVGPAYKIEMARRLRARTEMDMVILARMAASAEGMVTTDIPGLIKLGFLPDSLGCRPDASQVVERAGDPYDLPRGSRGYLLPIPDMPVTGVTQAEATAYASFRQSYQREWERMDPVAIRVRSDTVGQTTKVTLDIHILPFARRHYDWLALILGGKSARALRPLPNEIAHIEGNIKEDILSAASRHGWAMLGLSDFTPRFELKDGALKALDNSITLPLHAAATETIARAALGKDLPAVLQKDASFSLNMGDRGVEPPTWWARLSGDVLLVAPTKERVEQLAPTMTWEEDETPAQVHLWLGNLAQSRARTLADAFSYLWARRVSLGNVDLLHVLEQQMKIEAKRCPETATRILAARVVCPGGGAYRLRTEPLHEASAYEATAFDAQPLCEIPGNWRFGLLDWIEHLSIDFSLDANAINSRVELQLMEHPVNVSRTRQP
ncbi:MAG: hypothetical protein NTW87_12050 [Planctomycetota bacterium]|nr:hypothetical protein [Planctomycetota bacterium]